MINDKDNTRESSFVDKEVQLQNMHKKYEQMAADHEQAEERHSQLELDAEENINLLPIPSKIIMVCLTLLFGGIILFTIGITDILDEDSQLGRDVSLLTIGTILLIPGLYYTYQLLCACFAKTKSERQQILNEFPLDYYD